MTARSKSSLLPSSRRTFSRSSHLPGVYPQVHSRMGSRTRRNSQAPQAETRVSAKPISPNSGQYQCRTRYCRADQRMPARLRSSARAKYRRQG